MLFLPRAEILRRLSARAAQAGGLTRAASDACPDLPSARTCQTRVGPWRRICARLGLYPAFIPGQIDKRRASTEWAKPQRGRLSMALTYTAFIGSSRLAQGDLLQPDLFAAAPPPARGPVFTMPSCCPVCC